MKNYNSDIEKKIESAWNADYEKVPETEVKNSWRKFIDRIEREKSSSFFYVASGAVAVFVVILTGYFFLEIYNPTFQFENNSPRDKEIALPDGSRVILKENSKISYKESQNVREVKLKGEAFFDVVKDSLKVFRVKTNNTITTVLGTSFNVREKGNLTDVKISLFEGKVLVSVKGKVESWAIVPGESFAFENGCVLIEEFDSELSFASGNEFIDVNNIALERLLKFLENRYDCQFEKTSYTHTKRVTLRINKSDSLEQILKILSIINNTNYELNKTTKPSRIFNE